MEAERTASKCGGLRVGQSRVHSSIRVRLLGMEFREPGAPQGDGLENPGGRRKERLG